MGEMQRQRDSDRDSKYVPHSKVGGGDGRVRSRARLEYDLLRKGTHAKVVGCAGRVCPHEPPTKASKGKANGGGLHDKAAGSCGPGQTSRFGAAKESFGNRILATVLRGRDNNPWSSWSNKWPTCTTQRMMAAPRKRTVSVRRRRTPSSTTCGGSSRGTPYLRWSPDHVSLFPSLSACTRRVLAQSPPHTHPIPPFDPRL